MFRMQLLCVKMYLFVLSFMDMQFPYGKFSYTTGEMVTANAFLPLTRGTLQLAGQYPGEAKIIFSFKVSNLIDVSSLTCIVFYFSSSMINCSRCLLHLFSSNFLLHLSGIYLLLRTSGEHELHKWCSFLIHTFPIVWIMPYHGVNLDS